jgi:hypothetical protein
MPGSVQGSRALRFMPKTRIISHNRHPVCVYRARMAIKPATPAKPPATTVGKAPRPDEVDDAAASEDPEASVIVDADDSEVEEAARELVM